MERSCIACSGGLVPFGRRGSYEYHRCRDCGTIQLWPPPDPEELAQAYGSSDCMEGRYGHDPDRCRVETRTYHQSVVRALRDHGARGPVLDFGSGWGGLLEVLRAGGFDCRGVEVSPEMAAYCRGRGFRIEEAALSADGGERLGAITMCAVFEHLVDQNDWLRRARRLLADRGVVVSLQPTERFGRFFAGIVRLGDERRPLPAVYHTFRPPWHVALFSVEGMRMIANRNGFDLVDVRPAPQGRMRGFTGIAQTGLEWLNRLGWRIAGLRWPLLPAHVFVLRKRSATLPLPDCRVGGR